VRVGCCASAGAPWGCSKPLGSFQSLAVDSQEMSRSEAGRALAPISCSIEYAFVSSRKHNLGLMLVSCYPVLIAKRLCSWIRQAALLFLTPPLLPLAWQRRPSATRYSRAAASAVSLAGRGDEGCAIGISMWRSMQGGQCKRQAVEIEL
jgi:hypothetical protein